MRQNGRNKLKSRVRSLSNRLLNNVLFYSGIVFFALLFFCCEKQEPARCWECFVITSVAYEDEPHLREIIDHYFSCDSLFHPDLFEEFNTWDWDTINGERMKRETTCIPIR